jgi:hypothetical protein
MALEQPALQIRVVAAAAVVMSTPLATSLAAQVGLVWWWFATLAHPQALAAL